MNNSLILTDGAKQYLRENLATSPEGTLGIRVGLRDAGCSGYSYTVDFTSEHLEDDHIQIFDDIKIFMSQKHAKAFAGTTIEFIQDGLNATLEFDNPNVIQECGCGESFQFKDDAVIEAE